MIGDQMNIRVKKIQITPTKGNIFLSKGFLHRNPKTKAARCAI